MSALEPASSENSSSPAWPPAVKRARQAPRRHLWTIGIPLVLVLLVSGLLAARLWLDAFLHGADFRHFLDRQTSGLLHADCRLEPLHWQGSEIYSEALEGTGQAGSPWSRVSAEQIRAELDLRALWHGAWRIDTLEIGKIDAALGSGAAEAQTPALSPTGAAAQNPPPPGFLAGLLPTRVEVGKIHAADLSLSWGGASPAATGRLQGAELTAQPRPEENNWSVTGRQGRLTQAGLPALRLQQFALRTNTHLLTITQAGAQVEGGGHLDFTGTQQLDGDKALAVDVNFEDLPTDSFLPPDWRARLHGLAGGMLRITGSPAVADGWEAHGHIDLHGGRLEALPVLDELALFTATARFRQTALQKGSADFQWQAGKLTVGNLLLEAEGLIRLEGGFAVRNEQVDGQVRVGIARSAGRLLAGVGARVFNEPERDGYLWTTVRLTGSVHAPHEDLTARLVQATQQEVISKAQQGAGTVLDTAGELLKLVRP